MTRKKATTPDEVAGQLLADPPGETDAGTAPNAVRREAPTEEPPKRKRGRPKGSKNKSTKEKGSSNAPKPDFTPPERSLCEATARQAVQYLQMGTGFFVARAAANAPGSTEEEVRECAKAIKPAKFQEEALVQAYADCFEAYGIPTPPPWLAAIAVTSWYGYTVYNAEPLVKQRERVAKERQADLEKQRAEMERINKATGKA